MADDPETVRRHYELLTQRAHLTTHDEADALDDEIRTTQALLDGALLLQRRRDRLRFAVRVRGLLIGILLVAEVVTVSTAGYLIGVLCTLPTLAVSVWLYRRDRRQLEAVQLALDERQLPPARLLT